MNKCFKAMLSIAVLPLLNACNSEGAFSSKSEPTVIEIAVTPSPALVLEGRTQQLVATAKYDNNTESDVSDSVTWEVVGDPTIASVSASGIITGNVLGDTELTASKDGITSTTVNVTVYNLAGPYIDTFDTGSGKLFTNSPSVAYLDSIDNSATTDGTFTEIDMDGPAGDFYQFTWANVETPCNIYNTNSIGGRTNWRLPSRDELEMELFDVYDNMFTERGWPTTSRYWSTTPDGSFAYFAVSLIDGVVSGNLQGATNYVSCVSNPES
ncbi:MULTISPECIES: DUF1566 domain-containing protein [unclassified Vibrio]|uniref:Lcl domain-containing protein n=1 Tax=unclassified Vibrio TaxID=2614977 RepID=UPI000C866734|nr:MULTISPECIES: DUF1566 domain-containing protein [unclassified Vibrio]PMI20775.1 hypothetical protein BCU50_16970 [Vibrio sp. 10N.286.46.E10]PMI95206.1 hypothetical protein BCU34_02240 [Vibrio sp. 10N.286.45.E10]PTO94779.1 hypothetical protein CWO17_24320 [Vibrio sp. 10N.286.45.A3]PTQ18761.1 hypothetical protein CWO24_23595 [Vibrio sp. 10N.286.46.E10]TKE77818.1 DUF1566 domain-containing protein [Vibrio sp. F12]